MVSPYDSAGVYFVRVTGQPNSYNIELEGVRGDTTPFGVFANSYAPIVLTEPTTTAEIGQFGIRLESEPTAPATLTLTSQSDGTTSAGTLSTSSLTFTPANWNQYQLVAVTPLDDPLPDGDQTLTVTATGWSNDAAYLDRTLVFDVLVLDNEEFQTSDVTTRVESSTLPKARLSGTGVSVAENPNGSTVTFGVELSKAVATETLVGLQFDDVSAVLAADFEVMSGVEVNWRDQTESTTHPLAGINITGAAAPAFVDIDGDGDQDLFVGVESGELRYFRNIGTASNPVFEERTSHPLSSRGTATLGGTTHPAFADVDRDGDYDLLLGSQDALTYYRNEGTATQPRFPFPPTTGADNPFAVVSVLPGRFYAPTFADIDGDGDQDLFVSSISSLPSFFRNEGNGSFVEKIGADNPAGALNTSATLTTVGSFTGGDVGEGLDLDGNFLYAVNVRGPAAGPVRDATFTADNAPGVAVTARYDVLNWHGANFGSTTNDNNLEIVMQSIRYETTAQGLRATLANLTPGTEYQLQLLFAESCCDRGFDIFVEGQLAVDNFSVLQTQGGVNNPSKSAVVTHQFVATDTTLDIFLSGLDATFPDRNPTLSGMTLEALGTTSNTTTFVDVDRDGDLDAIRGWATGMVVRENTGSPTSPNFTTASISRRLADVAATISQSAWAAFDLNGDGQPELVAGDPSDRFHIFSSNLVAPIATGQTSATVQLKILDDLVDETDPLVDETDPLIREGKSETIDVTLLQSRDYILDSSTAVRDTADVDQDGDTDEFITPADFIGSLTIIDNDVAAILVEPPTGTTLQEVGSSQTLRVSLATQPLHDVTVFVASSDATEALITTAANSLTGTPTVALTFKPDTWNLWQSVQVVSVDDLIDDGDRTVTVRFSSTGEDLPYRGEKLTPAERPLLAPEIAFMNADNDSVGITVIGPQEAVEGQDNVFSVVLNTQPMGQVRVTMTPVNDQIRIATARPGDPVTLEFDENNWDIAQLVQVTALDDGVVEYLHESRIQFDIETAREIDGPTVSDISTAEQAFDLGDITGGLNWTNFPFRSLFTFDNGIPTRSGAYFRFTLKQPGTELEQIRSFNAVSRSYLTLYERGDLLAAKPAIATTEELKSPVISLQDLEAGEYLLQVRSGNIGDAGLTIQFDSPDRAFESTSNRSDPHLDQRQRSADRQPGRRTRRVRGLQQAQLFCGELNVPAPAEIGDTGDQGPFPGDGRTCLSLGDPTSDKHDYSILADHFDPATETGWVRVAPGDVQANIGIVPVDDKRVEDLALDAAGRKEERPTTYGREHRGRGARAHGRPRAHRRYRHPGTTDRWQRD